MANIANFAFIIIFQGFIISETAIISESNETFPISQNVRKEKFFGVGLVRFANSGCTSGSLLLGTCLRRRQCSDNDGTASGTCASGIGVCCVIIRSCGDTSSYNSTYFTNSNYPSSETSSTRCVMTIERTDSSICQVRIDFLSFILSQPNATGVCTTDAFYVTGGAGLVPIICGENTGQHIYVDFNGANTIQMIVTTSASDLSRNWNLLVTQIACACPTRAPSGCLQFYNTTSGTVNSFNYGVGSNVIDSTTGLAGTRELVNENYGVCVNMYPGYCAIQWSSNGFIVTGIPGGGYDNLIGAQCTTDFVVIANPYYTNGTPVDSDRFCGTAFTTVQTSAKPFVLYVVTNGDETNDVANTGFSLSFSQVSCPNTLFT